ncbi:winged helix-turn-helix domain-containing protein [Pseudomonas sp. MYb541]|uniref:winged helix-turn-helix domain-containing protein n=1 Tax=Pseudomonas TaxID=286 RepID=UPI001F0171A7|nr:MULTISPECIES: winged helix-turn-helix domain-containing protein [Pseudomonas]MEB2646879.1 winged helix-turn-helix domain-containing protein [Pseudomonas canadensis]
MSVVGGRDSVMDDGGTTTSLLFAHWTLHDHGRLTGEGSDVQLPPKEWRVLRLLLVSGGALMTKDRLLELAWPQEEVAEESLTRCIYSLRKYLGADKGFIKTIYGRGYRFTCPVSAMSDRAEQVCSACGRASQGVLKRG